MGADNHVPEAKDATDGRKFVPANHDYPKDLPLDQITQETDYFTRLTCPHKLDQPSECCGRVAWHAGTLVIAVDGACPGNGRGDLRHSSGGVYVGCCNPLNGAYTFEDSDGGATNQKAELRAAIKGLDVAAAIEPDVLPTDDSGLLIIKTDSAYVHDGMVDWIKKWKRNGWQNSRMVEVSNRYLWEELDLMVESFEARGTRVMFWQVPRRFNKEADELANMAYSRMMSDPEGGVIERAPGSGGFQIGQHTERGAKRSRIE